MTLSGCSRGFSVDVHRKKKEIHRHVDCQTRRRRRTSIILRWRLTHERKSRRGRCSLSLSWDEEGILPSPYETPKIPTITQYIHATWISFSVSSSYTERERSCLLLSMLLQERTHTTSLGTPKEKDGPASSTSPSGLLYIPSSFVVQSSNEDDQDQDDNRKPLFMLFLPLSSARLSSFYKQLIPAFFFFFTKEINQRSTLFARLPYFLLLISFSYLRLVSFPIPSRLCGLVSF